MKMNLPVTGREQPVTTTRALVSRTDTKGILTYANDAFIEVSGYTREELVGKNHNIVRHPDVPPAIFKDMWDQLKLGQPWRGVVKNRCKNGDHYWVDAQVVPVRKNGQTIGYMSVRNAAAREDIPAAEAAYQTAAEAGKVHRQDDRAWHRLLTIRNGVLAGIVFVTLMMIAGGVLGIGGLNLSSSAIRSLYLDDMVPAQTIGRINLLMADNRAQLALSTHHAPGSPLAGSLDHGLEQHLDALDRNRTEIETLWKDYASRLDTPAERALAEGYWTARTAYVDTGLLPTRAALANGDYVAVDRLLAEQVNPQYEAARARVAELLEYLSQRAESNSMGVAQRNQTIIVTAMAGIAGGCTLFVLFGIFFFRATVLPLDNAVQELERITEGNLSGNSHPSGHGETRRVTAAVTVMRLHLRVMMDEIRLSAASVRDQCRRLNQTMMNLAEHSEEQHDRAQQTLDNIATLSSDMNRLAEGTDELLALTDAAGETLEAGADAIARDELPEDEPRLQVLVQELASAARIEAFTLQDSVAQIRQIATLIADNRGDVQDAWAASQLLERTAEEMDKLVKYFD